VSPETREYHRQKAEAYRREAGEAETPLFKEACLEAATMHQQKADS
jgi:hypothetical protein